MLQLQSLKKVAEYLQTLFEEKTDIIVSKRRNIATTTTAMSLSMATTHEHAQRSCRARPSPSQNRSLVSWLYTPFHRRQLAVLHSWLQEYIKRRVCNTTHWGLTQRNSKRGNSRRHILFFKKYEHALSIERPSRRKKNRSKTGHDAKRDCAQSGSVFLQSTLSLLKG